MSDHLLLATLEMAVPFKIADLEYWPVEARIRHAAGCADIIAAQGDVLLYGGKGCREAFGALVRALAVGAYQPGGIGFAGRLWCSAHSPYGARAAWPCAGCAEAEPLPEPVLERPAVVSIDVAGGRL